MHTYAKRIEKIMNITTESISIIGFNNDLTKKEIIQDNQTNQTSRPPLHNTKASACGTKILIA